MPKNCFLQQLSFVGQRPASKLSKLVKLASRTVLRPIKLFGYMPMFHSAWHRLQFFALVLLSVFAMLVAIVCLFLLAFQLLLYVQSVAWQHLLTQMIKVSIPSPSEGPVNVPILLYPAMDCHKVKDTVVFVISRVTSLDRRSFVRESWGKELKHIYSVPVVFVVGRSLSSIIEQAVVNESRIHGDILFVDVEDRYETLTLKHLALLQFQSVCKGPHFFYSVDDDYIVVPKNLLMFLYTRAAKMKDSAIFGNCLQNFTRVQRDVRHKNYLPYSTYKFNVYSPYCKGSGRILTSDVPKKLLAVVPSIQWLKDFGRVEDVVYLGLLLLKTNIKQININPLIAGRSERTECAATNMLCKDMDLVQIGDFITFEKMKAAWKFVATMDTGQRLSDFKFV